MQLKYPHKSIRKLKCLLPCSTRIAEVATIFLVAAILFQACQQEYFTQPTYIDRNTLVAEGRYLTARSEDALTIADNILEPQPFEAGTPFRLLAFSKPYNKTDNTPAKASTLRFNTVTREDSLTSGVRFMNIYDEQHRPDQWFGFSPLGNENGGDDGLVALDFYGFTYGKPADISPNYIKLDEAATEVSDTEESAPADDSAKAFTALKHTEEVVNNELTDLMRGELLNRNIVNAGTSEVEDENGTQHTITNPYTQSIIPFRHCFSKLRFQISQQGEDKGEKDNEGNKVFTPVFGDLYLDNIEVTNTYGEGAVYLHDGKVELQGDKINRQLTFDDEFNGKITVTDTGVGEMIVFPSDGGSLKNNNLVDGYNVGLKITVRSKDENLIKNFLKNTNTTETGNFGTKVINNGTIDETWYWGTIVKDKIIDYYLSSGATDSNGTTGGSEKTVKFKQNTSYMLIITFQKDQVRIITVIPQVVEWLPGETTTTDGKEEPWQDQEIGQPQMFDNIVWSDRNLGADAFDPKTDFEKTIGYFYQAGRNIPFYPFNTRDFYTDTEHTGTAYVWRENGLREEGNTRIMPKTPTPDMKNMAKLYLAGSYDNTTYRLFPMVDEEILNMVNKDCGYGTPGSKGTDRTWTIENVNDRKNNTIHMPQMYIPETKPDNAYYNFYPLWDADDMQWNLGQSRQPVKGSWIVPSVKDFMTIFPSTPNAGNITFGKGGNNGKPMDGWCKDDREIAKACETFRVTVPFYYPEMKAPQKSNYSPQYKKAWETLKNYRDSEGNHDPGTTKINGDNNIYNGWGPKEQENIDLEPDGDPEDGYASVYVISRFNDEEKNGDKYHNEYKVPAAVSGDKSIDSNGKETNKLKYAIQSWGTIYAIKRIYTPEAYRMRWRVLCANKDEVKSGDNIALYVEICRYRCNASDELTEDNYLTYDWDHPAAKIYFPICGLVDLPGTYINYGTECQYAASDKHDGKYASAVQIKTTGDDPSNAYISVIRSKIDHKFGQQIRPIGKTSLK